MGLGLTSPPPRGPIPHTGHTHTLLSTCGASAFVLAAPMKTSTRADTSLLWLLPWTPEGRGQYRGDKISRIGPSLPQG